VCCKYSDNHDDDTDDGDDDNGVLIHTLQSYLIVVDCILFKTTSAQIQYQ